MREIKYGNIRIVKLSHSVSIRVKEPSDEELKLRSVIISIAKKHGWECRIRSMLGGFHHRVEGCCEYLGTPDKALIIRKMMNVNSFGGVLVRISSVKLYSNVIELQDADVFFMMRIPSVMIFKFRVYRDRVDEETWRKILELVRKVEEQQRTARVS